MTTYYRRLPSALWSRPAFKDLGHTTQLVYLLIWSHPDITTAGTLDYHPARLAAFTGDLTTGDIELAVDKLQDAGMIAVDRDTEELAILTWWEDTPTVRQTYVLKNAIKKLHTTASTRINQAIADKLHTLNVAPIPSGLNTEIAQQYLAQYPPSDPRHKKVTSSAPSGFSGDVWAGHPFLVDDPADARCRKHAGGVRGVGCVGCEAAVRIAVDRRGW
jgi:hypothetical protein